MTKLAKFISRAARTLRFVIGAPDYEAYVEHLRARHPGEKAMSRAEFADRRLNDRYSRAGARCC